MAGIVFPDVAGSVLPALQIQKSQQLMDLEAARQRKLDSDQQRLDSAGQYIAGAVNGDPEAAANLARVNPQLFTHIQTLATAKDAAKLRAAQENAKWLAGASGAVLEAPPEERATAYAQHLAELKARGIDAGSMPQTYSPAVDAYLRYHLNSGVSADKYLETHLNTPQPMSGGAPGVATPAAAGPDLITKGQPVVSRLVDTHGFSPVAAAGVAGNLAHESGFNPGYGFTQPPGMGGANGIAQWDADRTRGLVQFAKAQGANPADLNTQVDYLVNEMKSGDMGAQRAYAMLQQAKTPEEAATAMLHFERPQGYTPNAPQNSLGYAQRVRYAQQFAPNSQVAQAPVIPQGGDQAPPTGNQPGVMPQPAAVPPPPPIQTLHDYVQSVVPGGVMLGTQKGGPAYDHAGNLRVQPPGGGPEIQIPPPLKPQEPPAGYRKIANGNLEAIPGGPADLTRGYEGIPKNITGPAVYQALIDQGDVGKAAEIKSIVEGRNPLPDAKSRVPNAIVTRQLAFQADPDLTDATHAQRMKTLTDLNSGKPNTAGYQLQAQGTLFNHLAEAVDENQKILNSPYPLVNRALNAVGMAEGDPRLAAINVTLGKVNAEGEKAFEGKTTVSGLAKAAEDLKATMGTPAFAAAARAYMTLVNGQQTQLIGRLNRGLGYKPGDPRAITQDNAEILTPDAKASRDRILAQTQPNPADNSTLMDKGKQVFGAKSPPGSLPMPQTGAQGPHMSPEDAMKLPSGTPFIGLDGQPYVRH